jgi:hypothetical protein
MILRGYLGEFEAMEFRNGTVPEWEMVTGLGLGEVFVGFARGRSSILGIAGSGVMGDELRFC